MGGGGAKRGYMEEALEGKLEEAWWPPSSATCTSAQQSSSGSFLHLEGINPSLLGMFQVLSNS